MSGRAVAAFILVFAISVVLVGMYTGFAFGNLDVQLHDTYFVYDSAIILFVQTLAVVAAGAMVLSIGFLKRQHVIIRLFFTIVFSLILFVPLLAAYTVVMSLFAIKL